MATASVTLSLNNSAFLAGMARARASVSALGSAAGGIAGRGLAVAGAAVVALGTATAIGIKKAFDFGGKLADMSAISGRSVRSILLLRRALEDAGVSMEKIDRYILTGQDRGEVIARALKNMSEGDWADAAASVGKQADILDKNAKTFDRVSDLLGRTGSKLQGFFVGAANSVANSLLPFLEKFDKMDFAGQGEKFGEALKKGAEAIAGVFEKPELFTKGLEDAFAAAALGLGNVLYAVLKRAGDVFGAAIFATMEKLNPVNAALIAAGRRPNKSFLELMEEGMAGSKLEVKDVFGAGNAAANVKTQGDRAAEAGKELAKRVLTVPKPAGLLGPEAPNTSYLQKYGMPNPAIGYENRAATKALSREEMAAAGQQKLAASYAAQDLIRSKIATSSQTGLGEFKGFGEFESQWGTPKPSDLANAGKDKSEEHLAKIRENSDEQTEITREAWGKK